MLCTKNVLLLWQQVSVWMCSALACKAAVDNALSDMEALREAHTQKERDLHIQQQASAQAADQIPSIRYLPSFQGAMPV